MGALRGTLAERLRARDYFKGLSDGMSRETPVGAETANLAFLDWWELKESGSARNDDAPEIEPAGSKSPQFFMNALFQGRGGAGIKKGANPLLSAMILRRFTGGSAYPERLDRIEGDSQAIAYEAVHLNAMTRLRLSANKTHGLPPRLRKYLRARLLRGLEEAEERAATAAGEQLLSAGPTTTAGKLSTAAARRGHGASSSSGHGAGAGQGAGTAAGAGGRATSAPSGDPSPEDMTQLAKLWQAKRHKHVVDLMLEMSLRINARIGKRGANGKFPPPHPVDFEANLLTALEVSVMPSFVTAAIEDVRRWLFWRAPEVVPVREGGRPASTATNKKQDEASRDKTNSDPYLSNSANNMRTRADFSKYIEKDLHPATRAANCLLHILQQQSEWVDAIDFSRQPHDSISSLRKSLMTSVEANAEARGEGGDGNEELSAEETEKASDETGFEDEEDFDDDDDGDSKGDDSDNKNGSSGDEDGSDSDKSGVSSSRTSTPTTTQPQSRRRRTSPQSSSSSASPPTSKAPAPQSTPTATRAELARAAHGKWFVPPLFTIVPVIRLRRRHVRIDFAVLRSTWLYSMDATFDRPPPAHPGEKLGATIMTDGYNISILYERPKQSVLKEAAQIKQNAAYAAAALEVAATAAGMTQVFKAHVGRRGGARGAARQSGSAAYVDSSGRAGQTHYAPRAPQRDPRTGWWRRLIAVDPGSINIVTCLEVLADGSERVWKLTRAMWRAATQADRRIKRAKLWLAAFSKRVSDTKGPPTEQDGAFVQLAAPGAWAKTASAEKYVAHMRLTARLRPGIMDETLRTRWADEAFRAKQAKQRVLSSFWATVRAGRLEDGTASVTPMVAYGGANFASSGAGRAAAPTTAAYVACVDVMGEGAVVLTTEHRSTKCCSACGHVLRSIATGDLSRAEQAKLAKWRRYDAAAAAGDVRASGSGQAARNGKGPLANNNPPGSNFAPRKMGTVRGVKVCNYSACPDAHARIKDRDENACRNIRLAFMSLDARLALPDHMLFAKQAPEGRRGQDRADHAPPLPLLPGVQHCNPHGDGGLGKPRRREALREADAALAHNMQEASA